MVMFHSYVKLPEGTPKIGWWMIIVITNDGWLVNDGSGFLLSSDQVTGRQCFCSLMPTASKMVKMEKSLTLMLWRPRSLGKRSARWVFNGPPQNGFENLSAISKIPTKNVINYCSIFFGIAISFSISFLWVLKWTRSIWPTNVQLVCCS